MIYKTPLKRREASNNYKRNHKQQIAASRKQYRINHLEQELSYNRKWAECNKKHIHEYSLLYAKKNKDRIKKYQIEHKAMTLTKRKERNLLRKILVLTHYGNGKCACTKCGYTDIRALSIDHINGAGGKHRRITGSMFYLWLINNNYPDGLTTLCMNCQFIKRDENREYGKGRYNTEEDAE
jgi:hypothetical protein